MADDDSTQRYDWTYSTLMSLPCCVPSVLRWNGSFHREMALFSTGNQLLLPSWKCHCLSFYIVTPHLELIIMGSQSVLAWHILTSVQKTFLALLCCYLSACPDFSYCHQYHVPCKCNLQFSNSLQQQHSLFNYLNVCYGPQASFK